MTRSQCLLVLVVSCALTIAAAATNPTTHSTRKLLGSPPSVQPATVTATHSGMSARRLQGSKSFRTTNIVILASIQETAEHIQKAAIAGAAMPGVVGATTAGSKLSRQVSDASLEITAFNTGTKAVPTEKEPGKLRRP